MQRERVAESIYVFTSQRYIEVTAGVVITPAGCVIIDTLPFPSESRALRSFAQKACRAGIRYVINTHYHADHTYGNCFFEGAPIISHRETRRLLGKIGDEALRAAQAETPELNEVSIRLPDITYRGRAAIRLGELTIELIHAPGNSPDGTMVYVAEEKVLFAGDAMLPVPYVVSGDVDQLIATLRTMKELGAETLVQGHGDTLLRGEIPDCIDDAIRYLRRLREFVKKAAAKGASQRELLGWDIEKAGLSRIPLGGVVQDLHRANVLALYKAAREEQAREA